MAGHQAFDLSKSSAATSFVPDALLNELADYLSKDQEESRKVGALIDAMLEVEALPRPLWGETKEEQGFPAPTMIERNGTFVPNPRLKKIAPLKYEQELAIATKQAAINRELAKFRFLPHLSSWSNRHWLVTWHVGVGQKHPGAPGDLSEGTVLQLVLDLGRAGQLNRLRRCMRCRKWLYATYKHQTFCSKKCQEGHYRKSEEWKAKRRAYMQEYRHEYMRRLRKGR